MMKTVLITGASTGIGYEFAKIFAAKNHNLVLVARNSEKLNTIKSEFENNYKIRVHIIAKDLAKTNAAQEIYDDVKINNIEIDYLINNAGIGVFGNFSDNEWEEELQSINLNITALVHLSKLFVKDMVNRKFGKILNVASTAAFQPGPGMAIYFASKAFVLHFSEAINFELKNTGVSVTALCPGPTDSNFFTSADMKHSSLFKNNKLATSQEVAAYGFKEMMKGTSVAIHGFKNYILANSIRFSPRDLATRIAHKITV